MQLIEVAGRNGEVRTHALQPHVVSTISVCGRYHVAGDGTVSSLAGETKRPVPARLLEGAEPSCVTCRRWYRPRAAAAEGRRAE